MSKQGLQLHVRTSGLCSKYVSLAEPCRLARGVSVSVSRSVSIWQDISWPDFSHVTERERGERREERGGRREGECADLTVQAESNSR